MTTSRSPSGLFTSVPVDRFLLEYDDDRAGGFEPLAYMPEDKTVVLGLVSSKTPVLETAGALRQRIDEAAKFIDPDRLALSPQCGFASIAQGGNQLTAGRAVRQAAPGRGHRPRDLGPGGLTSSEVAGWRRGRDGPAARSGRR